MYRLPQSFYRKINKGDNPAIYIAIQTHMGIRIYSDKQLNDYYDSSAPLLDGTWLLDGSMTLGGGVEYVASKEPRVLQYDRMQKTLTSRDNNLLTGYQSKRQNTFSVVLNNADRQLGELMAREPFITRPLSVYLGYDELTYDQHIKIYSGVVDSIEFSLSSITLNAIEA